MTIEPYSPRFRASVLAVLNDHAAATPPFLATLDETTLSKIVANSTTLWAQHARDKENPARRWQYVAVEGTRAVGFAVAWQRSDEPDGHLPLLVFDPEVPDAGEALIARVVEDLAGQHCTSVSSNDRNPVGLGWFGVPETWPHVTEAFLSAGFEPTDGWTILTGTTDAIPIEPPRPANEMINCVLISNEDSGEWRLEFYHEEQLAGECETWAVPVHLAHCQGFSDWVTIEWVGVEPAFRRRGLAFWLVVKQMHFHLRAGRTRVMLWTGPENHAAKNLYHQLGFAGGPDTIVFSRSLIL